ncbi:MAG: hypothetical protein ACRD1S_02125 [Vicinamibacterales bacterium]
MRSVRISFSVVALLVLGLWLTAAERASTLAPPVQQLVLTQDADHPARNSFHGQVVFDNDPTPEGFFVSATKKLVIEFVSASCFSTLTRVHSLRVDAPGVLPSDASQHFFAPVHLVREVSGTFAVFTHPARMYISPANEIEFIVSPTTNTPSTTCTVNFSGYLITP